MRDGRREGGREEEGERVEKREHKLSKCGNCNLYYTKVGK